MNQPVASIFNNEQNHTDPPLWDIISKAGDYDDGKSNEEKPVCRLKNN